MSANAMGMIDTVAGWLRDARCVVALTGAGVSTASGIPDFRGPQGVWTRDPDAARLSTLQAYVADPEVRRRAWRLRLEHPAWTAEPSPAHVALAQLEELAQLDLLVTQNIDGLHQRAGSSIDKMVEIHGTLHRVACLTCGDAGPMTEALDRVRTGEDDPACRACGGILKSATISFGQSLVAADLDRALAAARSCDLLLAVGTSLAVYPVASLPEVAVAAGARLVIVNEQPTPLDGIASACLAGDAGDTLALLVRHLRTGGG